jgi:PAS domain S-box-containing protein
MMELNDIQPSEDSRLENITMISNQSTQLTVLKRLFDLSPIATALSCLPDGKFVEANEAFLQLHGFTRDEVLGHTSAELELWHRLEGSNKTLESIEKGSVAENVVVHWRHKSGKTGTALLHTQIIILDGNSFMAKFLTDTRLIDERQQLLIEADYLYSTLFNELTSGIAVCRMRYHEGVPIDFIYLRVNPAFEKLTGLLNVQNRWVSEVIPGIRESNPQLFEIYGRVAKGGCPETFEVYISLLKSWLEISVFSHLPEHFVAEFNVITNHKRLEQELRVSSERLELVIKASKMGTWDSDRVTGRVVFDKRWCEIIGYDKEDIDLTTKGWQDLLHPDDKARTITALKEHERGDTPMFQCEYRLRHKEGHWVWVSSRGQIVARDVHGKPLRILGTVQDISVPRNLASESAKFLSRIETMLQDIVTVKLESQDTRTTPRIPSPKILSRRQREVLILIAQGMTSPEIAGKLKVGKATVVSHRRSLMKVLGLHSAADLTRYAIKHVLVSE